MKVWEKIVLILAAIGAINWGLAELGYDLVELILGSVPTAATIVYYIIVTNYTQAHTWLTIYVET